MTLRGDFAAAALSGQDELLLARSRFGGRSLYWTTDPRSGALLACSRLSPIVAGLDGVSVNETRLAASLIRATLSDQTQTHYRGIHRVPSACVLRVGPEGVRARYDTPFDVRPVRVAPIDDLADELRELIFATVTRSLEGVDHAGVLVSGGLDSATLLAAVVAVAKRSGKRVDAFNLNFAARGDDRAHLNALCEMLGVTPVRVSPRDCGAVLPETFVIDRSPTGWSQASWDIALTRRSRDCGAAVLLSGLGGDEVFGGDMRMFVDRARQGHPWSSLHAAARLQGWSGTPMSRMRSLVLRRLISGVAPRPLRGAVAALRRRDPVPWAGPQLRRFVSGGAFEVGIAGNLRGRSTDRSWLEWLARSGVYLQISEARAQVEMAAGCARVDPFLDDDLVEFAASLRPDLLFHGGWSRGLLRYAMRGLLPESLRLRQDKSYFEPALQQVVEGAGGFSTLGSLASATALADLGLVEPRRFRDRFDELSRDPLNGPLWIEVWSVLAGEAFVRQAS